MSKVDELYEAATNPARSFYRKTVQVDNDLFAALVEVYRSVNDYHGRGHCYTREEQIDRTDDPKGQVCPTCVAIEKVEARG